MDLRPDQGIYRHQRRLPELTAGAVALRVSSACGMTAQDVDLARVRRLEALGFRARPAAEICFDGTWMMRLTPSHPAKRLNSINPLDRHDSKGIDARIELAEERFRAADRQPVFRLTPLAPPSLDDRLAALGWRGASASIVMRSDLSRLQVGSAIQHLPVRDMPRFVGASLQIHALVPAMAEPFARLLTMPPGDVGLFLFEEDGAPLSTAVCVLDGPYAGLFDVATLPAMRGRGIGRRLVTSALNWARLRGASVAWLQVEADNEAALALYRSLGFMDAYRYHYRLAAA